MKFPHHTFKIELFLQKFFFFSFSRPSHNDGIPNTSKVLLPSNSGVIGFPEELDFYIYLFTFLIMFIHVPTVLEITQCNGILRG